MQLWLTAKILCILRFSHPLPPPSSPVDEPIRTSADTDSGPLPGVCNQELRDNLPVGPRKFWVHELALCQALLCPPTEWCISLGLEALRSEDFMVHFLFQITFKRIMMRMAFSPEKSCYPPPAREESFSLSPPTSVTKGSRLTCLSWFPHHWCFCNLSGLIFFSCSAFKVNHFKACFANRHAHTPSALPCIPPPPPARAGRSQGYTLQPNYPASPWRRPSIPRGTHWLHKRFLFINKLKNVI